METNVYENGGITIRRVALGYGKGAGYEIMTPRLGTRLTEKALKKMVFVLLNHIMDVARNE